MLGLVIESYKSAKLFVAYLKSTTMNPDHDCSIGLCLHRSVEVEKETVFTDAHILHGRIQLISKLRTGVSLLGGIVRVRPSGHRMWLLKTGSSS